MKSAQLKGFLATNLQKVLLSEQLEEISQLLQPRQSTCSAEDGCYANSPLWHAEHTPLAVKWQTNQFGNSYAELSC